MAAELKIEQEKFTYRRFKDGDDKYKGYTNKILNEDTSFKCPTYVHKTPPCQGSCPSGHDIRGWLDIVRGVEKPTGGKSWQEYAFERMTCANPFPAVMGRVCPAPCEDGCNRNQLEDKVGINSVEQFIGDYAIEHNFKFNKSDKRIRKKIAVIGAGPGGLAAAYQLAKKGYSVTVYEELKELGGMMAYGIPGYRVPRSVLEAEINRILALGVETVTNTKVGRDISFDEIEKKYDSVVWAIGTHKSRSLPVDGFADASNCLGGVEFLRAFNDGRLKIASPRVIVVGGGDTSIDVASVARRIGHITDIHEKDRPENVVGGQVAHDVAETAKREGAEVTLTSLFPLDNMTASEEEIEDAQREGIDIRAGVMPLKMILDKDGRAIAMQMCKCTMDGDRPIPTKGTEFELEADLFVAAIGQAGDLANLSNLDNGKGFIDVDNFYQVPEKPGHFVCGDIVRPHLLTTAIGQASIAAQSVDNFLNGKEHDKRPKVDAHHFSLLLKLQEYEMAPKEFVGTQEDDDKTNDTEFNGFRGTDTADYAVHNYEDRAEYEIITQEELFLGHFAYNERNKRKSKQIGKDEVLGNFEERLIGLDEEKVVSEAKRCMSCGMCFECDNCVIFCPQDAVFRVKKDKSTTGRYVDTDYSRCIGCHICSDVCPTGYIEMAMGH
jgi:glutamate synthase (NADPH) small chain